MERNVTFEHAAASRPDPSGRARTLLSWAAALGLLASTAAEAGTIRLVIELSASADEVWSAVRDFHQVHRRLVPGVVVDTHAVEQASDETRRVTFANGAVIEEVLLGLDDRLRRLAYASVRGRARHHAASMEVEPAPGGSRIVWTTDVLPESLVPGIRGMMEQGASDMRRTFGGARESRAEGAR